jgi:folylpolyglutamate synthase
VKEMTLQKDFAEIWSASDHHAKVHITSTVEEAIHYVQELDDGVTETNVFVTGSFHLVGGVLALLEGAATPGTA